MQKRNVQMQSKKCNGNLQSAQWNLQNVFCLKLSSNTIAKYNMQNRIYEMFSKSAFAPKMTVIATFGGAFIISSL